jgi:hypothetical protein
MESEIVIIRLNGHCIETTATFVFVSTAQISDERQSCYLVAPHSRQKSFQAGATQNPSLMLPLAADFRADDLTRDDNLDSSILLAPCGS